MVRVVSGGGVGTGIGEELKEGSMLTKTLCFFYKINYAKSDKI